MSDPEEPMTAQRLVTGWARWKQQQDYREEVWGHLKRRVAPAAAGMAQHHHGGWPYVGAVIGCLLGAIFGHNTKTGDTGVWLGMIIGASVMAAIFLACTYVFRLIFFALGLFFGGIGTLLARLHGFPAAARRGATWGAGAGMIGALLQEHESMLGWGLSLAFFGAIAGIIVRALSLIFQRLRFHDEV